MTIRDSGGGEYKCHQEWKTVGARQIGQNPDQTCLIGQIPDKNCLACPIGHILAPFARLVCLCPVLHVTYAACQLPSVSS